MMNRKIGTTAQGIRLPIINRGDDLAPIVVDALTQALTQANQTLHQSDVIGVTEAIVAKAQNNFATIDDIAADVRQKFGENSTVGVVFPILSRNRFYNMLKGIARGAAKVIVLLQYPSDEVGNPIMDLDRLDEIEDKLPGGLISAQAFREAAGSFAHPFTGMDYIDLYESVGEHVEVYLSKDPRDIVKLTDKVLVAEIHARARTRRRVVNAGAKTVYTLSDILNHSINGSGYNPEYGLLGSNLADAETLKLFPRDCMPFVERLQQLIAEKTGVRPEVMIYGDGAFKDPFCGIWELADPVVSPAYTERLGGRPNEIKLKYVAETVFGQMGKDEKQEAVTQMIRTKNETGNGYAEGTTPRKYADLLGSLCDLMSGSGDKGTPVILIQGYFDDYATE